jgi:cytochrome b
MRSSATSNAFTTQSRMDQVWDPLMQAFHWSLVAAFAVAYLSGDEARALRIWPGYAVGGLVLLRIVWASWGPGTRAPPIS